MAGALADPADGAVLVFRGPSPQPAESFAEADPYVRNGLVKRWRVRKWNRWSATAPSYPTMTRSAAALFTPFSIKGLTLPNRIVMAPMTRSFSPGGVPGEDVAAYYRRRAEGGVGLIITEGTYPPHPAAGFDPKVPHLYGEAALRGWRHVVDQVHAAGGHIFSQLWHVGLQVSSGPPPAEGRHPVGPSGEYAMTQQRNRCRHRSLCTSRAVGTGNRLRRRRAARSARIPDRSVLLGENQPAHRPLRRGSGRAHAFRRGGHPRGAATGRAGVPCGAAHLAVEDRRL